MNNKIAIIIPAFNEEVTIAQVLESFAKAIPEAYLYVVDNNSSDNTQYIARESYERLHLQGEVLFEKRRGKANAVRYACKNIDADIYVMVDADLTYDAQDIHTLIQPVLSERADMVVGDRHSAGDYSKENKRPFHNFGNILVRNLINLLFGVKLVDIMSGYRVFSKKFIKNYPILCEGFELETDMTLHAVDKRYRIVELPCNYKDRPEGSVSKLNTIGDGILVIKTIIGIFKDYKPMLFFGTISMFCFLGGSIIGSIPVIEYFQTGLVLHVPSAILATGCMISALVFFAIGIILGALEKANKTQYELRF